MSTIHIVEIIGTTASGNLQYDLTADEHLTADEIALLAEDAEDRGSYAVVDTDGDGNEYVTFFGDYAACQCQTDDKEARRLPGVKRRTVLVIRWMTGR